MQAEAITSIIFDLDGVLVDSRELHFKALNAALATVNIGITIEEHLGKYDGLPTKQKLELLTIDKGLSPESHSGIWELKQLYTVDMIESTIKPNPDLRELLQTLRDKGYNLYVASNSINATLEMTLKCLGIRDMFNGIYSNEDVKHPKPNPEIYLKCFVDNGLIPRQCLIVEDSPIGRTAAYLSGAHVCEVSDPSQVVIDYILNMVDVATKQNEKNKVRPKWLHDIQVVIPMAGDGRRFAMEGYTVPKPLIDVNGKMMIERVIENLELASATYIFVVRQSHLDNDTWNLQQRLEAAVPNCRIVATPAVTEGPACTVLLAENVLDLNKPIIIANSDQYLEWDANAFLYQSANVDGCISVFHQPDSTDTKWSYVLLDDNGLVTELREKMVISDVATTGIYYWKRAGAFVQYAKEMIAKNIRVNNEFYVGPVYNEAIADGKVIKVHYCDKMWGLGIPTDLNKFLNVFGKI